MSESVVNDSATHAAELRKRLIVLQECVAKACSKVGRKVSEVTLLAAAKKQPILKMVAYQSLCRESGALPVFGENYLQDFEKKKAALCLPYEAHLIGRLQSNKVKAAVSLFDVIQSVDSFGLLEDILKAAQKISKQQRIFIQVNISDDPKKGGVKPSEVSALVLECLKAPAQLFLEGLMTITQNYADKQLARPDFRALRELKDQILDISEVRQAFSNRPFQLSMGMSQDFDVAIEEGATLVRIGTALFGERK